MPRFVVLEHVRDETSHLDLMLEHEGVLLTFSFAAFPAAGMTGECLFDHRLRYLEYEGDIGRGRGTVRRVESGRYDLLSRTEDAVRVQLRGGRLVGAFRLVRTVEGLWQFSEEA